MTDTGKIKNDRKLKNFFVKPHMQSQETFYCICSFVVGCFCMGVAVFLAYVAFAAQANKQNLLPQLDILGFMMSLGLPILLGTCFVLGILFLVPFGILVSHRVAGPVIAIQKYIQKLQEGDYSTELTLRENDELKEIAESLNQLATRLKKSD